MGILKQLIDFKGGLNLDDADEFLPKGDWRGLENMRASMSEGEDEGGVESIRGDNLLSKTGIDLGTGSSAVYLGMIPDLENKKVYYFYKDTGPIDYIIEYDITTGNFDHVFKDDNGVLNFTNVTFIHGNVLNGVLYYTDGVNPPRKINIAQAKETMDQGFIGETIIYWNDTDTFADGDIVIYLDGFYESLQNGNTDKVPKDEPTWWDKICDVIDAYADIEEQELDVIAHPPVYSPEVLYSSDGTRKSNNLRGVLFQFAYRYVYRDYRKSIYSPASIVPLPEGDEDLDGDYVDDPSQNNVIDVSVITGSQEVLRIEIIFRSSKDLSTWYQAGSVDIFNAENEKLQPSGTTYTYRFYNNQIPIAVDGSDVVRPFDYVPQIAGSQEIVDNNTLVYGNITEGYPNTKLSVEKSITTEDLTPDYPNVPIPTEKVVEYSGAGPPPVYNMEVVLYFPTWEPVSKYYNSTVKLKQINAGTEKTAEYTPTSPDTWNDVRDGLLADIATEGMDSATCATTVITFPSKICFFQLLNEEIEFEDHWYADKSWEAWIEVASNQLKKHRNLKSNASHIAGIVYYDRARRHGPVNTHVNMRFYLDPYRVGGSGLEFEERWKVQFTINSLPPDWAESYQLVYAPAQSVSYFMVVRLYEITDDGGTDNVFIKVNERLDGMRADFERTTIADYEWQKGDRVRFIGTLNGSVTYPSEEHDYEIEGVDDTGRFILKYFDYATAGFGAETGTWSVVEIYRPTKELSTTIFYEIGQEYEVGRDGNNYPYHKGDTDQTIDANGNSLTGAIVRFWGGDSFKYIRIDDEGTYWTESMFYSDNELNGDFHSLGFAKVEDPDAEQKDYGKRLRWGGSFFANTESNYIAKFDYNDLDSVNEKFGDIQRIVEVGYVLKILQSHKNTSFYIRRVSYIDPNGKESFTLVDQLFGTKRPEIQDWGTQNPESVIRHERYLYFWDRSSGKFIRDAANGMFAISDYKMKRWFKDLTIDQYGNSVLCHTGYNESYEELWVSFYYGGTTQKTWIFSEYKKRWTGNIENLINGFVSLAGKFYATYQGNFYEYNTDDNDYHNFNGSQKVGKITVVANDDYLKVKVWNAISEYSNKLMNAPTDGDISIPANENYTSGMSSRIHTNNWRKLEGFWMGQIMRDLNTPGSDPDKIINGRPMRGNVLEIKLRTTTDTVQTIVQSLIVHATPSERSKI